MPLRYLIDDAHAVKQAKSALEAAGLFNKLEKIHKNDHGQFVVSSTSDTPILDFPYEEYTTKNSDITPKMPKKYAVYPPMVLLSHPLESDDLSWLPSGCTHVAINQPIDDENNAIRRPTNLKPLVGDFGPEPTPQTIENPTSDDFNRAFWCSATQNQIWQTWAPRHTMFSRGNITEKARILHQFGDLSGTVVVDLYCGIGYFSLSYLRLGATIIGWDINPWSIEGFRRALENANYTYKVIYPGDPFDASEIDPHGTIRAFLFLESNEHCLQRLGTGNAKLPISHVNLGLLPSSKPSWPIAHQLALNSTSNTTNIHVHENVHKDDIESLGQSAAKSLAGALTQTTKVKTFAPDVWHVVYDISR
ncbi:hypothetical protein DIURU_003876 [Diutina rugosa]|uniref:tRNA wybutosine-synthesizing protein 2 n=1 Tax=Diutina rugosa TaxID=5481 RepID=A0A642UJW0_DIURU|nr:uncharacterized protein DIURU_003876 [Diutina rugosa]KAA8900295.1 hypothetical protein DIURU_003876 [Diutina rugosa]